MKKLLSFTCLAMLLIVTLSACGDLQPAQFKKLESYNMKGFNLTGTEVEITAIIYNPNKMGFKVKDVDLDVFMSRKKMGRAKLKKGFKISANSEKSYTFTIIVKPDGGLLQAGMAALSNSKGQSLNLKGKVKVGKLGITKEVDVDVTQSIGR